MAHLQIISLFKNKSAQELTPGEVHFINEYLQQHPELIPLLGGQAVVEDYLAEAVEPDPLAQPETVSVEKAESNKASQANFEPPSRPWIFRITALLVLMLIGWTAWFGMKQAGIDLLGSRPGKAKNDPHANAGSDKTDSADSAAENTTTDSAASTDGLWYGWNIETADGSPVAFQPDWIFSDDGRPRSRMAPVTRGQPMTFSITRQIEKDDWLALHFKTLEAGSTPGTIEIKINDEIFNRIALPARLPQDPYLIPLHDYQDQQLQLQLTVTPGDDKEQLQWNRLEFFQQTRSTQWYPLEIVKLRSRAGTQLTIDENRIISAQRGGPGIETYVAQVTTSLPNITAFRLEAFPEQGVTGTRRAKNRKWHYIDTSFVLSSFRVATAASKHRKISGRYVKLMTSEERSYLSLAEVQVFSGGKNVALQGKASQSTPDKKMGAAMAIDNHLTADGYRNKNGKYARSMTKTRGKKEAAWWQVDLGQSYDIDRIVVHSPTVYSQRSSPFYVMVLKGAGNLENDLAWESHLIKQRPSPSLELMDSDSEPLIVSTATTDILGHEHMVKDSLQSTPTGWNLPDDFQKPQQAFFTLQESTTTNPTGFIIYLGHNMHSRAPTLGRFRLAVTNAKPPFTFAPVGTIVRHQNDQPMTVAAVKSPEKPEQESAEPKESDQQQADERKAAEAKAAELKAAQAKVAKEAEAKRQEAAQKAALEAQNLARQKEDEARRLAQEKRQEALRKAQKKRAEALRKAREKRAADAKKRAEQLAARRKADAKRRADQAAARKKAEAKRKADEDARRKADAKKRAEQEAARKKAEQEKKS